MIRKEQYGITGICDYYFGSKLIMLTVILYSLSIAQEEFFFERVAMAFPPDSPWIHIFNKEIKGIVQTGIMGKWKQVSKQLVVR